MTLPVKMTAIMQQSVYSTLRAIFADISIPVTHKPIGTVTNDDHSMSISQQSSASYLYLLRFASIFFFPIIPRNQIYPKKTAALIAMLQNTNSSSIIQPFVRNTNMSSHFWGGYNSTQNCWQRITPMKKKISSTLNSLTIRSFSSVSMNRRKQWDAIRKPCIPLMNCRIIAISSAVSIAVVGHVPAFGGLLSLYLSITQLPISIAIWKMIWP